MRRFTTSWSIGLVAGLALGMVIGLAGDAAAVFMKKGWERFGSLFQQGYVAGFTDAVRLGKSSDPESYLSKTYTLPAAAKAMHWQAEVNALFAEDYYEDWPVISVLQVAGERLTAKFGPEARVITGMERLQEFFARRREAAAKKYAEELKAKADGTWTPPQPSPGEVAAKERARIAAMLGLPGKRFERMSKPMKRGWVNGFNACVVTSKVTDPRSFVATHYVVPSKPDDRKWVRAMEKVYEESPTSTKPAVVVLARVGAELAAKHGAESISSEQIAARKSYLSANVGAKVEEKPARDGSSATEPKG